MNLQNVMQIMQMMNNPQAVLQKMGIPQEHMSSPQNVAQYLLDNGKVTQQQIQQANQMYSQYFKK